MTPDQLRAVRRRYGESQERFARRVGVSKNTILRWESGVTLTPEPIALLMRYLEAEAPAAKERQREGGREKLPQLVGEALEA